MNRRNFFKNILAGAVGLWAGRAGKPNIAQPSGPPAELTEEILVEHIETFKFDHEHHCMTYSKWLKENYPEHYKEREENKKYLLGPQYHG